jgi:hypothetical protein
MPLNLNRLPFRSAFPNDRAALVHIRTRFTQAAEQRDRQARKPVAEVVLGDGFRVRLPVYMVLDRGLFARPGVGTLAELLDDPVIGPHAAVYTDAGECTRAVRARRPLARRSSCGPCWRCCSGPGCRASRSFRTAAPTPSAT